jgi:phosphatidylinositol dimannoside acyltransferase
MLRYRLLALLSRLALIVPRRLAYAVAAVAADVGFAVNGQARRRAEANMRVVLGRCAPRLAVLRTARRCFRSAAFYYVDLFRTPVMDPDRFYAHNLRVRGFDHVATALAAGRGVIMATIHYGNPEYAAQAFVARGITFMAFTEPLQPPEVNDLFDRLRDSKGNAFVPVSMGAIKTAIRHLRAGGVLCIVVDRDIQGTGVDVPFFGRVARFPTGAVDLARHTNAVVLPAVARRLDGCRFLVDIEPPIELDRTADVRRDRTTNTARLIQRFEPYIRKDPGQWFVIADPIWGEASLTER